MTLRVDISEYNKLSDTKITQVQIIQGTTIGFSKIDNALVEVQKTLDDTKELAEEISSTAVKKAGDQMQGPLGITTLTSPTHGDLVRPVTDPDEPDITNIIFGNKGQYPIIESTALTIDISDGENFATVYTTSNPPSAHDVGTLSQDQINTALSSKTDFGYVDAMIASTAVSKSGDTMSGTLTISAVGEGLTLTGWDRFAASYIAARPGYSTAWQLGKLFAGSENIVLQNTITGTELTLNRNGIVSNNKDFYVGTSKVWHEGNLEPVDKTYVDDAISAIGGGSVSGTIKQPITLGIENLGVVTTAGAYTQTDPYAATIANGYPVAGEPGTLLVLSMPGVVVQKWIPFSGGPEYSRVSTGGTFGSWVKSFDSANLPSIVDLGGLAISGDQSLEGRLIVTSQDKKNQVTINNGSITFKKDNLEYTGFMFNQGNINSLRQLISSNFISYQKAYSGNGFLWGTKDNTETSTSPDLNFGFGLQGDGSLVLCTYEYNTRNQTVFTINSTGTNTKFEGSVQASSFVALFPQNQAVNALTRKDYVDQLIADLTARIAVLEAKSP